MGAKEYKLPKGKTTVFEYDHTGVGKITLECMDILMDSIRVIDALDSVTWYNGLAETILKWKDIKPKNTIIQCLDDYGYGEIEMTTESWKDIGQLQAIWMICVVLFGDYGSSPRYGFIYEKNIKEFHDFIDAITETQRIE